jgi:hypothetical protein
MIPGVKKKLLVMNIPGSLDFPVMNTLTSLHFLSIWYQHDNWFTKKITGAYYSRESQLNCVIMGES